MKKPFRDPEKAYKRIKQEFDASISNAYDQCKRVQEKFIARETLKITDKGNPIDEINTTFYKNSFSIIVKVEPFGQIQNDLSLLQEMSSEEDIYPWTVKIDDLEVFLFMIKATKLNPIALVQ